MARVEDAGSLLKVPYVFCSYFAYFAWKCLLWIFLTAFLVTYHLGNVSQAVRLILY